ncbi:RNA recognition motif domain-containing protein [Sarocladium implicatum]|nr:RNA recognition motif domain-containing protein [Sarocladium implicatum]
MDASNSPIATVYVQNLEERVKPEPLTEALRTIFSQFGNVLDVVAKQNLKAKGQAFVVFEKPESAQEAISEVHGFELFGKPMRCAMARTKSDKTIEQAGNAEELDAHKRHRLAEKDKRKAVEAENQLKRGAAAAAADGRPAKASKPSGLKSTSTAAAAVIPDEYLPPNKILFLQNIPEEYGVDELTTVFGRFEGFREVRLVPGRRGIAFVEYDAEQGAIAAKENTAGMSLGDKNIKVTYQRQ